MAKSDITATNSPAATVGLEAKLRAATDALRNNMDATENKHSFLTTEQTQGADPEDPYEYHAERIFWVSREARRPYLTANAPQPTIGKTIEDAMVAIKRDNPPLNDPDCPGNHDGGSWQLGYPPTNDPDYFWMRPPIHQLNRLEGQYVV
jgi:hypothetical protein